MPMGPKQLTVSGSSNPPPVVAAYNGYARGIELPLILLDVDSGITPI